ncbi:F0F1 ATP synthase subunit B [Fontivita pretiosa]|uniref:F0F1 ATP synthase subunit B n=1 Tax=Fontivita pretiosa TaxID=2989684 RepID=UPI003D17E2B8
MWMRIMLMLVLGSGLLLGRPAGAAAAEEPGQIAQHGQSGSHATEAAHEKPGLLPDPTQAETWMQALWTVIIFVVMLAILYPTAWKNVLAGLKKREERIRNDIAEAEAARARAEATLREYNAKLASAEDQIRQMLANATLEGEKLATTIRMKAQSEAEEIKERANKEIEAARDAALREIYQRTAELATSIAEKILRRNLNPADQQELVRQSLEQLQTIR